LGFFPIYLGVKALWVRFKKKDGTEENETEESPNERGSERN
jgi:cadmium resistance protein CadD (predicted permease)